MKKRDPQFKTAVKFWLGKGYSLRSVAIILGCHRNTVRGTGLVATGRRGLGAGFLGALELGDKEGVTSYLFRMAEGAEVHVPPKCTNLTLPSQGGGGFART